MFQLKKNERVAYPGVKVEVKGPSGFAQTATSDKTGRWTVEVPGKGMPDHKFKKIPASLATGKTIASQDRREFGHDCGGLFARGAARQRLD